MKAGIKVKIQKTEKESTQKVAGEKVLSGPNSVLCPKRSLKKASILQHFRHK